MLSFSVRASVCAHHLTMRLQVSVCFTTICSQSLDLLAFPLSVAGTELRGYHPKHKKSRPLQAQDQGSVPLLQWHTCQDCSTESCISKHSTGVRVQILDRFPSSPCHCFLNRTLRRQLEHGILVDPHAVDCFNIQSEIRFVTVLMQKVNFLVCNSLVKLLPD